MPVPLDEAAAAPAEDLPSGPPAYAEPVRPSLHPNDVAAQVEALTRRLDDMADSFEATVRVAIAEEVQKVAGDLQHTVTALGRILVRDLGKLSQILGEHRDTIVAELRGGPGVESARSSQRPAGAAVPAGDQAATGTPDEDAAAPDQPNGATKAVEARSEGPGTVESADEKGASARQWRSRRRKA